MSKFLIPLIALLLMVSSAVGEVSLSSASFEASLGQKYESNLLSDWTQIADYTSTGHFAIKLYPFANLELNGSIDRNLINVKENTDPIADTSYENFGQDTIITWGEDLDEVLESLSTVTTGLHLTYIPTPANSRFSVYINGGVGRRSYDDRESPGVDTINHRGTVTLLNRDFQRYNTTDYDLTAATGYQYSPRVHLRSELAYIYNDYTNAVVLNDMVNSKRTIDAVVGGNWSIKGSNVLDLEVGLSDQTINRTFVDTTLEFPSPGVTDTTESSGSPDLKTQTLYLSPRFSRKLGERTGVTLTGTYRSFVTGSDIIVAGEAAQLLDPFATVWEGSGVMLSIKTFLIPRLITTLGVGYWDKTYLRHLEGYDDERYPSRQYRVAERIDKKSSIYMGLQMPLPKTWGGLNIEPVLSVEYGDNSSTIETYDYFGWDLALGVSVKR